MNPMFAGCSGTQQHAIRTNCAHPNAMPSKSRSSSDTRRNCADCTEFEDGEEVLEYEERVFCDLHTDGILEVHREPTEDLNNITDAEYQFAIYKAGVSSHAFGNKSSGAQ